MCPLTGNINEKKSLITKSSSALIQLHSKGVKKVANQPICIDGHIYKEPYSLLKKEHKANTPSPRTKSSKFSSIIMLLRAYLSPPSASTGFRVGAALRPQRQPSAL